MELINLRNDDILSPSFGHSWHTKCCWSAVLRLFKALTRILEHKMTSNIYRIFTQILSFIFMISSEIKGPISWNILWFKTSFTRHLHEFEAINTQGLAKEALFLAPKASIAQMVLIIFYKLLSCLDGGIEITSSP